MTLDDEEPVEKEVPDTIDPSTGAVVTHKAAI